MDGRFGPNKLCIMSPIFGRGQCPAPTVLGGHKVRPYNLNFISGGGGALPLRFGGQAQGLPLPLDAYSAKIFIFDATSKTG